MPSSVAVLELALTLVAVLCACAANVPACPGGHYLSRPHRECRKCDACPPNEIIRKPCSEDSNTMCRPFFEFHQFHQAPRPSVDLQDLPFHDDDDDDSEGASEGGIDWPDGAAHGSRFFDYLSNLDDETNRHSNTAREKHGKGQHRHSGRHKGKTTETGQPAGDAVSSRVQGSGQSECGSAGGEPGGAAPSVHNTETCDSYWKITSLCLIGVLGIVCVFLIVFIFVVCHLQNRRGYLKKVLYSVDMDPTGRSLPVSNHYIPVLTQASPTGRDAQRSGPTSSRDVLEPSYVYSDDYDADHSGQTVSTTKSSDYVYFKSPQNGNFCEV